MSLLKAARSWKLLPRSLDVKRSSSFVYSSSLVGKHGVNKGTFPSSSTPGPDIGGTLKSHLKSLFGWLVLEKLLTRTVRAHLVC
jgi:hypothetical protein